MRIIDKVNRAIRKLHSIDPESWKVYVEWLKVEYDDAAHESCKRVDEVEARWIQGHEQLLEMQIDILEDAITEEERKLVEKDLSGEFMEVI